MLAEPSDRRTRLGPRLLFAIVVTVIAPGAAYDVPLNAQPLKRVVAPFAVELGNGTPYRNPFSGGLWQPRTALRDVDADSMLDLFTLNPDGELRLYRNEGSFRFRRVIPTPYDTLPINSWFRFADLDGDGDSELLTSGTRSEVVVLYNEGSDPAPHFITPPRPLTTARPDSGATLDTIRTQRETVPSFVDIDADGDLDLFAGNNDGSISFYENTGTLTRAAFVFRTSVYEDIQVIASGITKEDPADDGLMSGRHGASVLDFTDLDGDGDFDILFGDFFTTKLLYFTNTGTPQVADFDMSRLDSAFRPTGDDVESEGFNQPVTGDIDGDGDIDAIISSLNPVASVQPLTLFENIGTRSAPMMRRRSIDLSSEIDVGIYATPAVISDATRKGILVGSGSGRISYFAYDNELGRSRYRLKESYALPGLFQTVPASGDLDGDGVAEVIVGDSEGDVIFMRFNGSALERFGDVFHVNRNASPTLVDIDGDNDLDLFVGAENGRIVFFENTGSRTSPNFVAAATPASFAAIDVGSDASIRFFDIDSDGRIDALIGGRTGGANTQRDTLRFLLNDGASFAERSEFPRLTSMRNPAAIGLDHVDGRFLLVGDLSGGIKAFEIAESSGIAEHPTESTLAARTSFDGGVITISLEWRGERPRARLVDVLGRSVPVEFETDGSRKARIMLEHISPGIYFFEAAVDSDGDGVTIPIVVSR